MHLCVQDLKLLSITYLRTTHAESFLRGPSLKTYYDHHQLIAVFQYIILSSLALFYLFIYIFPHNFLVFSVHLGRDLLFG